MPQESRRLRGARRAPLTRRTGLPERAKEYDMARDLIFT